MTDNQFEKIVSDFEKNFDDDAVELAIAASSIKSNATFAAETDGNYIAKAVLLAQLKLNIEASLDENERNKFNETFVLALAHLETFTKETKIIAED